MDIDKKIEEWESWKTDKKQPWRLAELADSGELIDIFYEAVNQLKQCREENNALRIVNETLDNFNKAIEQRTKTDIKKKILASGNIKTPVTGYPYVLWADVESAIDEAKVE